MVPIIRTLGSFEEQDDVEEVQAVFQRWTSILDSTANEVFRIFPLVNSHFSKKDWSANCAHTHRNGKQTWLSLLKRPHSCINGDIIMGKRLHRVGVQRGSNTECMSIGA